MKMSKLQETFLLSVLAIFLCTLLWQSASAQIPAISQEFCIELQGARNSDNREPVVFEFVGAGLEVYIQEADISENNSGCFYLPYLYQIEAGTHELVLRSDHPSTDYLTNSMMVDIFYDADRIILTDNGTNAVLIEGDANSDNSISGADASILVSTLNIFIALCDGDVGYDARADFNEDGCVTGADASILVSNLNIFIAQIGDSYP